MSFWQFQACVDGYNEVHGGGDPALEPMTEAEFDEMIERNADWIAAGSSIH